MDRWPGRVSAGFSGAAAKNSREEEEEEER